MTDFHDLLSIPAELVAALKSVQTQMSEKEKGDLLQLYGARGGVYVTRDKGNRVRGDTVYSCSKVGAYLTKHFDGVGPNDKMMWIGTIKRDAKGQERWTMRPQIKAALVSLGWV